MGFCVALQAVALEIVDRHPHQVVSHLQQRDDQDEHACQTKNSIKKTEVLSSDLKRHCYHASKLLRGT